MTANLRLMRRLGGVSALAALAIALNACGRVEPPQTGAQAAQAAPTAAANTTDAPELPTVQVVEDATPLPLPTLPPSNNTAVPVPSSPDLGPVLSGGTVQVAADFASSSDLSGWTFDQIYNDPVSAPAWTVESGRLAAPYNRSSGREFNDVLALTGPAQGPNYAFEGTALSTYNSAIGVVVGYSNQDNYVALVQADERPANLNPGLQLVQVTNGEKKVLGESATTLLQDGKWYTFRVEVNGNQVTASVDGKQVFAATADGTLGNQVGLYAGFEGGAFFSAARLTIQ